MPRNICDVHEPYPRSAELVSQLVAELKANNPSGQPIIEEERFPKTGAIRATVIWDQWEDVDDEDRMATILQAYEQVEGEPFRDRIALAIGLTVPEAHDLGRLPFEIVPLVRRDDRVTLDECRDAMIAEGASLLPSPESPRLRFPTEEEAQECVRRLAKQLPGSDAVWMVQREAVPALD